MILAAGDTLLVRYWRAHMPREVRPSRVMVDDARATG
jgi:hypothetical protein